MGKSAFIRSDVGIGEEALRSSRFDVNRPAGTRRFAGASPRFSSMLARAAAIAVVCFTSTSCTTTKLWQLTGPDPVAFRQDRMTEKELQDRGLTYRKDDESGMYYVDKTSGQRAADYAVRVFVTPACLAVDAVTLVPWLAYMAIAEFADSGDVIQSSGEKRTHK